MMLVFVGLGTMLDVADCAGTIAVGVMVLSVLELPASLRAGDISWRLEEAPYRQQPLGDSLLHQNVNLGSFRNL